MTEEIVLSHIEHTGDTVEIVSYLTVLIDPPYFLCLYTIDSIVACDFTDMYQKGQVKSIGVIVFLYQCHWHLDSVFTVIIACTIT